MNHRFQEINSGGTRQKEEGKSWKLKESSDQDETYRSQYRNDSMINQDSLFLDFGYFYLKEAPESHGSMEMTFGRRDLPSLWNR